MKAKSIDFNLNLNFDSQLLYEFDSSSLNQILTNLLSNALKFTPKGGRVDFHFDSFSSSTNKCDLVFHIIDSGPGIPKEKINDVFSPFEQIDSTYAKEYKGTGLGLAISSRLAELMNGKLSIKSTLNVGSTFSLSLPVNTKANHLELSDLHPPTNASLNLEGSKILVVDDVLDNQFIVQQFLKHSNYALDFAKNGEEAIAKFKTNNYNLILMDIQMPGLDGLSATQQIRTYELTHRIERIPIIALSAYSLQEELHNSLNAGCDDHLTKPIKKQTLLKSIEKWLIEYSKKEKAS